MKLPMDRNSNLVPMVVILEEKIDKHMLTSMEVPVIKLWTESLNKL
jgi:hypothetical protein